MSVNLLQEGYRINKYIYVILNLHILSHGFQVQICDFFYICIGFYKSDTSVR